MIHGKDREGKHFGSKVFPGTVTVVQAQIPDDKLDQVLDDLESFKQEKEAHQHLQGLVLPVDKVCRNQTLNMKEDKMPESYLLPQRHSEAKCRRCKGEIAKDKISGRSSYFCPNCQS